MGGDWGRARGAIYFSYMHLSVKDPPTFIQSLVSEDGSERTKCFDLGENRTEDVSIAIRNIKIHFICTLEGSETSV